jgi:hypothetical protein
MPVDDFAAAVRVLYAQSRVDQLSPADHDAVRAEGKARFLQVDLANTSLNYRTLEMLHWLCRFTLDQDVVNRTRAAVLARKDNWAGRPFEEVWAKFWMMYRLQIDDPTKYAELRRWVAAGGTLDQIPTSELHYYFARQCLVNGRFLEGSFTVAWNGFVTAPQTGKYVFSISPINSNAKNPHSPVKFAMTVSVGGQMVLNSSPANAGGASTWVSSSAPVTLTGGRPVALKVTVSFEGAKIPDATLHAILSWQGPGMAQSVIPADNLTQTMRGGAGLQATYNWKPIGQPQTLTRVDRNIDFSWAFPPVVLAQDTTATDRAADVLWTTTTSDDFLRTCLGPPLLAHPFFREPDSTSAALSTARRSAFHALLLQNPALLDAVKPNFAVDFYQAHRFGAPESALDVFGVWAGRQADLTCAISSKPEFDETTRRKMAIMAALTTLEMPSHATRLQNEYLQTADGRCSLPVAYTLAASYLGRQKLGEWTAFLDNRLNDTTLTGDLRVNWLIARAEAEEIRQLPQDLDIELAVHARSRALDGKGYLDQALQAAQSPAVKARVTKELAARLVWGGQYQTAQDLLRQTSQSLPAEQQAVLAELQTQITGWTPSPTQLAKDQAAAAKQAYLTTLKQRRDQAAARGDTAAVNRYNGLINAATGQ